MAEAALLARVRPALGERVFVTPPPSGLLCSVCQDAFTDVRAAVRKP
jgi:hypothetical protein